MELGGIDALVIKQSRKLLTLFLKFNLFYTFFLQMVFLLGGWPVSDDTVLHLAVAECLIKNKNLEPGAELYLDLVKYYKKAMQDMNGMY